MLKEMIKEKNFIVDSMDRWVREDDDGEEKSRKLIGNN